MNLNKIGESFTPTVIGDDRIHIIGCGSVGSTLAENLARFGLMNFNLWDFDKVEPHNLVNQMFTEEDIGQYKTDAVKRIIARINPDAENEIRIRSNGYTDEKLGGYIFLCVDNIELRRKIVENHRGSTIVKAMFDFRTGLYDAQHYAADWQVSKDVDLFYKSMDFSHEEAAAETPRSACGVSLCVAPTVRIITGFGAMNFINLLSRRKLKKLVVINSASMDVTAM